MEQLTTFMRSGDPSLGDKVWENFKSNERIMSLAPGASEMRDINSYERKVEKYYHDEVKPLLC